MSLMLRSFVFAGSLVGISGFGTHNVPASGQSSVFHNSRARICEASGAAQQCGWLNLETRLFSDTTNEFGGNLDPWGYGVDNLQPPEYREQSMLPQNDGPLCQCGNPSMRLTSNTQKNPGRTFFKCEACNFFEWEDEMGNTQTSGSAGWQSSNTYQAGGSTFSQQQQPEVDQELIYETPDLGDRDRKVRVRTFAGRVLVDIRELYQGRDGGLLPSKKGIALSPDEWYALRNCVQDIDNAVAAATASLAESQSFISMDNSGFGGGVGSDPQTHDAFQETAWTNGNSQAPSTGQPFPIAPSDAPSDALVFQYPADSKVEVTPEVPIDAPYYPSGDEIPF